MTLSWQHVWIMLSHMNLHECFFTFEIWHHKQIIQQSNVKKIAYRFSCWWDTSPSIAIFTNAIKNQIFKYNYKFFMPHYRNLKLYWSRCRVNWDSTKQLIIGQYKRIRTVQRFPHWLYSSSNVNSDYHGSTNVYLGLLWLMSVFPYSLHSVWGICLLYSI